jgi:hypothetical protein
MAEPVALAAQPDSGGVSGNIATMSWLSGLLGGGDEVGWDDLLTLAVDKLAALAHHGARGAVVFADEVQLALTVPAGSVAVARTFVEDPRFDREVGAALANRCDVPAADLPVRGYQVTAGERLAVTVTEQRPRRWELAVEGGDRGGLVLPLPAGTGELTFGRGEWHGPEGHVRNDLVVCDATTFVSRRAGVLHRAGNHLEVAAYDQGDLLVVRRADGEVVRPARTARGRAVVKPGDTIELSDGREAVVRLVARRAPVG